MNGQPESFLLQNVLFPRSDKPESNGLFCRDAASSWFPDEGGCCLKAGDVLDLSTYMNALQVGVWRAACAIEDVVLHLYGQGRWRVVIEGLAERETPERLLVTEMDLRDAPSIDVPLGAHHLVYAKLEALEDGCTLEGGAWATRTPPLRTPKIAIIVTTFNRPAEVARAVDTLGHGVIGQIAGYHRLFLINNGDPIEVPDRPSVTVIDSKNLGGAGGFTRGLIEARRDGDSTHAIFMDDDASCEPEGLFRTSRFMAYAKSDDMALSGTMFYEDRPCVQHEASAVFHHEMSRPRDLIESLGHKLDMRTLPNVARSGRDRGNYGGWWYFCFRISAARYMPMPFFVRGDDIEFCIHNRLDIRTLNGVSTRCPRFEVKNSAFTLYLATRANLAIVAMHGSRASLENSVLWLHKQQKRALTYLAYSHVKAAIAAYTTVAAGPEAFFETPNPLALRLDLEVESERQVPLPETDTVDVEACRKLPRLWRLTQGFQKPTVISEIVLTDHDNTLARRDVRGLTRVYDRDTGTLFSRDDEIAGKLREELDGAVRGFLDRIDTIQAAYQTCRSLTFDDPYWYEQLDLPLPQDESGPRPVPAGI